MSYQYSTENILRMRTKGSNSTFLVFFPDMKRKHINTLRIVGIHAVVKVVFKAMSWSIL